MSAHDIATTPTVPRARRAPLLLHRWAALPVVLAGTFMVVLDFFIVNVAMPAMQTDVHASTGAIEWVVAGYGLTFATLLITAGRLGDRHGRRRMFSAGLALFTLASAACGLAWSPTSLVAARLVQGVAAALLSPQVLSIIGVAYTGPDRVRALSVYGIVLGFAAVGGQLLGGVLVQADIAGLGWRSCFLINVPIGIAALAVAGRAVPESRGAGASGLDLVGTVLVTAGLTAVLLPLVEGRAHGWPLWTWLSLPGAGGLLVAFRGLVFTILAVAYLAASLKAPGLTPRLGRRLPALGALVLATVPRAAGGERRGSRDDRAGRPPRPRAPADRRRDGARDHAADRDGARLARARARGRRGGGGPREGAGPGRPTGR